MCKWQVIFLESASADGTTLAPRGAIANRGVKLRQMTKRVKPAACVACFGKLDLFL